MVGDVADLLQHTVAEVVGLVRKWSVVVLHHDGYTAERTVAHVRSFVKSSIEALVDDRVERGVHLLDTSDGGFHQLGRRDLTVADHLGLRGCVEQCEIEHRPRR